MKKLGLIIYGLLIATIFTGCGIEISEEDGGDTTEYMTFQEAKIIALERANVSAEDAVFREKDMDLERHGKTIYDIEFMVDQYKYEYEIDAVNGEVILEEREIDEIYD